MNRALSKTVQRARHKVYKMVTVGMTRNETKKEPPLPAALK